MHLQVTRFPAGASDAVIGHLGTVINYGEGGGGYKMGKSRVRNFMRLPLKTGLNFLRPPPF